MGEIAPHRFKYKAGVAGREGEEATMASALAQSLELVLKPKPCITGSTRGKEEGEEASGMEGTDAVESRWGSTGCRGAGGGCRKGRGCREWVVRQRLQGKGGRVHRRQERRHHCGEGRLQGDKCWGHLTPSCCFLHCRSRGYGFKTTLQ